MTDLNKLKCPKCKSSNNIILFINFKDKTATEGLCFKRNIKPHLVRKYNKINNTGCGNRFKITLKSKEVTNG